MSKKDAMIDIETLGTTAGDIILSVGYLEFDPTGNDSFIDLLGNGRNHVYQLDVEEQIEKGYTKNKDTVEWWGKQSKEAQKNVLEAEPNTTLVNAFEKLQTLLAGKRIKDVWTYGYMDLAMLNYHSMRETGKELVFYRKHNDLRTVAKLMEFKWDERPKEMIKHDPVHDCVYQALAVQRLMRD